MGSVGFTRRGRFVRDICLDVGSDMFSEICAMLFWLIPAACCMLAHRPSMQGSGGLCVGCQKGFVGVQKVLRSPNRAHKLGPGHAMHLAISWNLTLAAAPCAQSQENLVIQLIFCLLLSLNARSA